MLNLTYVNERTLHKVEFTRINDHIISVKGSLSAKTKGFTVSRIGRLDGWDYSDYTTIYRVLDNEIQFSNDGSVWIPKVSFSNTDGGTLNGNLNQEVYDYKDLVIPTPIADTDYEFTQWSPEIPTNGEIPDNQTFTAIFTSTLPVPEPGPTLEDRMTIAEEAIKQNTSDIVDTQNALCELSMLSE